MFFLYAFICLSLRGLFRLLLKMFFFFSMDTTNTNSLVLIFVVVASEIFIAILVHLMHVKCRFIHINVLVSAKSHHLALFKLEKLDFSLNTSEILEIFCKL